MSYTYPYPRPTVTVDVVLLRPKSMPGSSPVTRTGPAAIDRGMAGSYGLPAGLELLLIQRGHEPFAGRWALPGGFLELDEAAETAAWRELIEETGLDRARLGDACRLTQCHAASRPGRDPRDRCITLVFGALVAGEGVTVAGADDAASAAWCDCDALPPLAFDHDEICALVAAQLRWQAATALVGWQLLPATFTAAELTAVQGLIDDRPPRESALDRGIRLGLLGRAGGDPSRWSLVRPVSPLLVW